MENTEVYNYQYTRSLIEASLGPLITINPKGQIMEMNRAMVDITGRDRDKLSGTYFSDYFTDQVKANEVYLEVFKKGLITDFPLTFKHINNQMNDVFFKGSVYKDVKGNIIGAVMIARDAISKKIASYINVATQVIDLQNDEKAKRVKELASARKKLEYQNIEKSKRAKELASAKIELFFQKEEKEKQAQELIVANYARSLIEASRDPLFTINLEGKITDLNNASVKIIGLPREELIGSFFFNYFTDPENARLIYQKVYAHGFVVDYPLTLSGENLTDVLFNGSIYKDENGNLIGVVVVARDITEQKRIKTELIEAKVFAESATLLAEEAKLYAEDATKTAENAVKSKQQFLSNMSHEIRTPMNAIIGFTKVVLKTELSSKQKEYLLAIKTSGDALIVLINDVLDLAKVDSGKMIFEQIPFKMDKSIFTMLHLFKTRIHEKNIKFIKEYDDNIPDVLVGDPVRLHQIILNLVSNAVKFTSKGSIKVSVKLIDEDEDKVKIKFLVSDTGIGIPESKIKDIFENFQQATSGTSRIYGGTGLGLAIVKQLVEQQGGSVQVESIQDKGSTFSFDLSFMKTNVKIEAEIELENNYPQIDNVNVLVVEDIPINQLLMKTLLDDFGFKGDIAANGKIAIEMMSKKSYDIILMDLQMPEMNGFEATNFIRNTMKSKIPIIALTADVTTVDLGKCKDVGMNDYIAKPVDEKILYNKIVGFVKKPFKIKVETMKGDKKNNERCIDMEYLTLHTKSNPKLISEMIRLFLEQTPHLIDSMKKSLENKDWHALYTAVHKLIPSFAIMGINKDFEDIAKKIQTYASTQKNTDLISDLVFQIENVCNQACTELEEEFNEIKKTIQ